MNARELGFVEVEAFPAADGVSLTFSQEQKEEQQRSSTIPLYWNIPYQRNPFFTGREALLPHLREMLTRDGALALVQSQHPSLAISGLGGIGKTQTAVEYAYCYHQVYEAVFWIKADTRENLLMDFMAIAMLLDLVEKSEKEPYRAINAVKRWLKDHRNWLLILDNADDLAAVCDILPLQGQGHTLLTTRATALGRLAKRVEIETMEADEGALFLLRRIGILETQDALHHAPQA